jgi:sec-independent protein translocase protein TatB
MEIFGIGASELIFILLIAIIVLGPKDMEKAGRTIGRWLNQLVRSDGWKVFQKTSTELRNLPRNLMREANMELGDVDKEIKEIGQTIDPRYRPPASSKGQNPSDRDAAQSTEGDANPPPLNKPPKANPLDPDFDTEQND